MKIGKRFKNKCYVIRDEKGIPVKDDNGKDLVIWQSRSVAISTIVLAKEDYQWFLLANKRGKDTPDYQGCWNNVCGYLEGHESAQEGCTREVYEETGVLIRPEAFKLVNIESNPYMCSHGNVTLRFLALLPCKIPIGKVDINGSRGGETNEVSDIKWIPIEDINKYQWAFNHKETIYQYLVELLRDNTLEQEYKNDTIKVTYD